MILSIDDTEVQKMLADLDDALGPELTKEAQQIAHAADVMVLQALRKGSTGQSQATTTALAAWQTA